MDREDALEELAENMGLDMIAEMSGITPLAILKCLDEQGLIDFDELFETAGIC